jgi:hypothetical protein
MFRPADPSPAAIGSSRAFEARGDIMRLASMATLCGALAAAMPALSQEPPLSTRPGPQHALLDSLAGWWTVKATFRFGEGEEMEGEASCEAKSVLGGRFLEQQYRNPTGLEATQYLGYDNQRGAFFLFKLDNMDTGYLLSSGNISGDSTTITMTGTHTDPASGARAPLRIVYTIPNFNEYRVEWFMTRPDGKEIRTVRLDHTRVNR